VRLPHPFAAAVLVLAGCALASASSAATPFPLGGSGSAVEPLPPSSLPAGESVEATVQRLEEERREAIAHHDRPTLALFYADDFEGVTTLGKVVDKATVLDVLARSDPRFTFTASELKVRPLGEVALATGRLTGRGTVDGRTIVNDFRYTHVYVRRDGRWQLIAGASTPLPPS